MSLYEDAQSKLEELDLAIQQTKSAKGRLTDSADELSTQLQGLVSIGEGINDTGARIADSQSSLEELQVSAHSSILDAVKLMEDQQQRVRDELQEVIRYEAKSLRDQFAVVEDRIYEKQSMLFSQHRELISDQNEEVLKALMNGLELEAKNSASVDRRLRLSMLLSLLTLFGLAASIYISLSDFGMAQLKTLLGLSA